MFVVVYYIVGENFIELSSQGFNHLFRQTE